MHHLGNYKVLACRWVTVGVRAFEVLEARILPVFTVSSRNEGKGKPRYRVGEKTKEESECKEILSDGSTVQGSRKERAPVAASICLLVSVGGRGEIATFLGKNMI